MKVYRYGDYKNILEEVNKIRQKDRTLGDRIVKTIYERAETLAETYIKQKGNAADWNRRIDDILTSKWLGVPIMLLLLGVVFWITLIGANYPSAFLADILFGIETKLTGLFVSLNAPPWLHGVVVLGLYRCMAWVISVMLPPMAIFFPLFTLLEDLGYLPRIAFNLDRFFKIAGAHGKQALTMCMGFGCNAAGVIACRIIHSPKERLIAVLTNNFVPCNGRFPALIALSSIFFSGLTVPVSGSIIASLTVVFLVVFGVVTTFIVSRILATTMFKNIPSSFTLELPPFRKPQIGKILIRSLIDRTLFVLSRAVIVAAPAGAVTWMLANTMLGDKSIIALIAGWLDPSARLMGLDGVILLAFILGLPANEIVVPIIVMAYLAEGTMTEPDSLEGLRNVLISNGWTPITALCTMLFSLLHFPCGTTLLTIKKETQSLKWPVLSALITTSTAAITCFIVYQSAKLLNLV